MLFRSPLPPVLANTIIVPWVLKYAYGAEEMVWFMAVTVGIGEILACYVLGMILLFALNKVRRQVFDEDNK